MNNTQVFIWEGVDSSVSLEVNHEKFRMILNVTAGEIAEKMKTEMNELNQLGTYPNELFHEGTTFYQFFISWGGYSDNWNCRWRDLITMVSHILGFRPKEKTHKE